MSSDQSASGPADPSVDHLVAAIGVTGSLIGGVREDQLLAPTPCPDFNVSQLLDHLVGYAIHFADKAHGVNPPTDPESVTAGTDPEAAYRKAGDRLIEDYRSGLSKEAAPMSVALVEIVTHGWDLATATGQPMPFPDAVVESALHASRGMLSPKYRGVGMPFGDEVEASSSEAPMVRLVAFMGRNPNWSA